MDVKFKPK